VSQHKQSLSTLRFKGARFDDHGLELSVLPELLAYRTLLVETAKELWHKRNRKENGDSKNLPKNFEDKIRIKFYAIQSGSTAIPLESTFNCPDGELPIEPVSEVEDAAKVIDLAIDAATRNASPPEELPARVISIFDDFGKTLADGESIEISRPGQTNSVVYNAETRSRISQWVEKTYEDSIDLMGEVRSADLDGRQFAIRLNSGRKIPGKFSSDQEQNITEALREHDSNQLRIVGKGEFRHNGGTLKRIIQVSSLTVLSRGFQEFDKAEVPFWKMISDIGNQVPDDEWKKLPENLSETVDAYLYENSDGHS
jgi:hypothetical protein